MLAGKFIPMTFSDISKAQIVHHFRVEINASYDVYQI